MSPCFNSKTNVKLHNISLVKIVGKSTRSLGLNVLNSVDVWEEHACFYKIKTLKLLEYLFCLIPSNYCTYNTWNLKSFAKYFVKSKKIKQNWIGKMWKMFKFWPLSPKINFRRGGWALGCVLTQFGNFLFIPKFPKSLSLKLFGNSWSNL